jgi:o-succinylbenzoate---CoA ligase
MKNFTSPPTDWLLYRSEISPDTIALIFKEHSISYQRLNSMVNSAVGWLENRGLEQDNHIGLLMENRVEWVVLMHAISRLGAILVPLNTRLTKEELDYQISFSNCDGVISNEKLLKDHPNILKREDYFIFESAVVMGEVSLFKNEQKKKFTDVHSILFTSGTTGNPKGAQLTYGNHYYSAMGSISRLGHDSQDRWLACMPLYHVGGLAILIRACLYGITVVLHNSFEPDEIATSIEQNKVTIISLVPTMLFRFISADLIAPLKRLRLILLGGAKITDDLLKFSLHQNLPIQLTYGLTEASSQVVTTTKEIIEKFPGAVGKPLMGIFVSIVNENGIQVPENEIGEIIISGSTVMKGYYPSEGFIDRLATGDLGYLDDNQNLWLVQRRSDLIVSGGENIYPSEIEKVLLDYPFVKQACVVGQVNQEWGQQVSAAIVLTEFASAMDSVKLHRTISEFASKKLASYKIPRDYYFVEVLPMTASGKIQRGAVLSMIEGIAEERNMDTKETNL